MPPSARSRPFVFSFHANGRAVEDEQAGGSSSSSSPSTSSKPKIIPVNSFAPIELENEHFKGCIMVIHDTGNEVGLEDNDGEDVETRERRGVILSIQGKFKKESTKGADTASGLYLGGELTAPLKLGFIMSKMVGLCGSYAKKKTEGRFHFVQGDAKTLPQLAFPIAQLFTTIVTPAGEEPPRLGTPELHQNKWQGAARIDVNTTSTYTFFYKTPFLDACSWELLNVPGVSPLPLERILGEIIASDVVMYDLGVAGSHANFRKGAVLSFFFTRREPGEGWLEDEGVAEGAHTPLDEASDPSEASGEELDNEDEAILLPADTNDEAVDEAETDSSYSGPSVEDDEDDVISRAESQALVELEHWRPRPQSQLQVNADALDMSLPFYIETIDRRRIRRLRVWYVFNLRDKDEGDFWTAKAINELASLCRPRPRLRAFRRRRGAHRGCKAFGVSTLEQFRQVVLTQLTTDTKLKRAVVAAAKADLGDDVQASGAPAAEQSDGMSTKDPSEDPSKPASRTPSNAPNEQAMTPETSGTNSKTGKDDSVNNPPEKEEGELKKMTQLKEKFQDLKTKTGEVKEEVKQKVGAVKTKAASTASAVKSKVRRKGVPMLPPRFFVSFNSTACEKAFENAKEGRPFVVQEGLVGAVHFEGRICEELLRLSKDGSLRSFMPYDCDKPRLRLSVSAITEVKSVEGVFLGRFHLWEVHTLLRVFVFCSPDEQDRYEWIRALSSNMPSMDEKQRPQTPIVGDMAGLLMDLSRARRWRPSKRIVLNDRILLRDEDPQNVQLAEVVLDRALRLGDNPTMSDLSEFIDSTCRLKALNFQGLSESELLAFWMNVYHCLLLHGRVLLGRPKSRGELARFYSRVSYLVGTRPVSLKDIERHILKVPSSDVVAANAGRARGRQFFAWCCFCSKRRKNGDFTQPDLERRDSRASNNSSSSRGSHGKNSPSKEKDGFEADSEVSDVEKGQAREPSGSKGALSSIGKCVPKPNVEAAGAGFTKMAGRVKGKMSEMGKQLPGGLLVRQSSACLFLGSTNQSPFRIPKQDMRVTFCLNRGNTGCLEDIPLFSQRYLNEQIEEVCQRFCSEFVSVVQKDGKVTRVILPPYCRGLKRELVNDAQALLAFVWRFIDKKDGMYSRNTHIKFSHTRREPRRRQDFKRLKFTVDSLNVDPSRPRSEREEKERTHSKNKREHQPRLVSI